jgi:hypothetical protein
MKMFQTECKMESSFPKVERRQVQVASAREEGQEWKSSLCQAMRIIERQR